MGISIPLTDNFYHADPSKPLPRNLFHKSKVNNLSINGLSRVCFIFTHIYKNIALIFIRKHYADENA